MQKQRYAYFKMFLYFFISILTAFCLELQQYDMHEMDSINKGDWISIVIKSSIPALISLRAYLDTSMSDIPHPQININTPEPKK